MKTKALTIKLLFLLLCLCTELFFFSFSSVRADGSQNTTPANTPAPDYIIENADYIRQSFSFSKETGLVQTSYTNRSGGRINLPGDNSASLSPEPSSTVTGSLPETYDLRTEQAVTSVKDQQKTGCCWSFAVLKSLESNLIRSGKASADTLDLSENHLAWFMYHPATKKKDPTSRDGIIFNPAAARKEYEKQPASYRNKYDFQSFYQTLPYTNGGNALFGTFVLARWSGAITENKAPFTADTDYRLVKMGKTMSKNTERLRYSSDYLLTDSICYDEADRGTVKDALMKNGAMEVSFYYDKTYASKTDTGEISYLQDKYTTNASTYANHCVTIIGWDDHFPKENFKKNTPKNDGAWLIANNYGQDYGKNGCLWISYEEPSLVDFYSLRGTTKGSLQHNYQYDGYGWTVALAPQNGNSQKAANIFTADTDYTQNLEAVSFYTATKQQPYSISIYRDVKPDRPESGKKMATINGICDFRGYHTVFLPKKVYLKAGQKFSIVISYQHTTTTNGYLPVEGYTSTNDSLDLDFSSRSGESFYYAYVKNTKKQTYAYQWADLNETPIRTGKTASGAIYHNVCLKAFTSNVALAGKVSFPVKKITLGQKEQLTLMPGIKQSSDKTLHFQSNNKKVVTVSKKGKIRAKKPGKATITAFLKSGARSTLAVRVKKSPETVSIRPRGKTLSVGKKCRITPKLPTGTGCYSFYYSSSAPSVAKVDKTGRITAKKKGHAVITVKTYNKKKATVRITVK